MRASSVVFILTQLNITNVLGPESSESDIAPCIQPPGLCRKQPPCSYHADGWMDGQVGIRSLKQGGKEVMGFGAT